jgi:peroxisomal 2,4-dienoyl-CoA reductase
MPTRQPSLGQSLVGPRCSGCALGIVGDVRDFARMEQVVADAERWGGGKGISILVNGAAGNFLCSLEDLSPNAFRTVVEIDLIGTFNTSKAAFPALKRAGATRASCACAAGIDGGERPIRHKLHNQHLGHARLGRHELHCARLCRKVRRRFSDSIHGERGVARRAYPCALTSSRGAWQWGKYGIRSNGVAPGPIGETPGMARLAPDGSEANLGAGLPAGRIGTKLDVSQACVYLASPAAAFITGAILVVDGGDWVANRSSVPAEVYDAMRKEMAAASRTKAKL